MSSVNEALGEILDAIAGEHVDVHGGKVAYLEAIRDAIKANKNGGESDQEGE